jgi:hypothetical protein
MDTTMFLSTIVPHHCIQSYFKMKIFSLSPPLSWWWGKEIEELLNSKTTGAACITTRVLWCTWWQEKEKKEMVRVFCWCSILAIYG